MQSIWERHYARRTERMKGSAIRELLKITEIPGTISLAGGLPAAEFFPVDKIAAVTQRILEQNGQQALQYSSTEGYAPLRALLAQRLCSEGICATADNILITTGSQQALDLLAKIMIDVGDSIVVESPTYMGALQACNTYEPAYLPVPMDDGGMIIDALEKALGVQPEFIYALPNFQNPSGVTLLTERRQKMIALAERYQVPVVEDDPYAQLRFEGQPKPSLLALEHQRQVEAEGGEHPYHGKVIQLNTFSKTLSPGLRLGWVVATPEVIGKLVLAKQGADLHTPTINQMIAYEIMQEGFLEEYVPVIRQAYRERRDVMLAELEESFPPEVRWTRPEGGMFLWVTLPDGIDTGQLLAEALEYRIAFVPGATFHAGEGGHNTMRLNFSATPPEGIQEGIRRLGRLVHNRLARINS